MDAVGPELGAAQQHQHPGGPPADLAQRGGESLALPGGHGAVVEIEGQEPHGAVLEIGQLAKAAGSRGGVEGDRHLGHVAEPAGQHRDGRQLDGLSGVRGAQVADPDRAVAGGAQDRAVARGQNLARPPAAAGGLMPAAEKAAGQAGDLVDDTGEAIGGMDLRQDGVRVVCLPVDRPVRLPHQRPRPASHRRVTRVERPGRKRRVGGALDGRQHAARRGLGHLAAVQAALGGVAHGEAFARPGVAGVHLRIGLQQRHAPFARPLADGPVERRRPAIAANARVHDQARYPPPDVLGNRALEKRRDDQVGLEQVGRFAGDLVVDVEFDGQLVTAFAQLDVQALRQPVEGMRQQQDLHGLA